MNGKIFLQFKCDGKKSYIKFRRGIILFFIRSCQDQLKSFIRSHNYERNIQLDFSKFQYKFRSGFNNNVFYKVIILCKIVIAVGCRADITTRNF